MPNIQRRDGPAEQEIEVTEEMIEAGVRVLWKSGALETLMDGPDQMLVQEIFVAMSRVPKVQS